MEALKAAHLLDSVNKDDMVLAPTIALIRSWQAAFAVS
jgi:hypothetical protein